jgi:hypothetical protein
MSDPVVVVPLPETDETVSFAGITDSTLHVSRKLLSAFRGSWFDEHFGRPGPITYPRWTRTEKSGRTVYHIDVPYDVLEAFIHLHALPELFALWTTQLPDCCKYNRKLETWQRYLALYFSNQMASLKRPREGAEEDEKAGQMESPLVAGHWLRDFSRPPKRFRRDFKEWEVGKAFIKWILDNHPQAGEFTESECEELEIVMSRDQTFPLPDGRQASVLTEIFGEKKEKRIKEALKRIIRSHYAFELKTHTYNSNVAASDLFRHPFNLGRESIWPVKGADRLSIDDRFMVLTFMWEDWDGSSL